MLNGLDLFSGIGGITLGLSEWVKPICYVEIDKYCQSVLKTRIRAGGLPDAPIWDDIKSFDGQPFKGLVDIIYGGFPCQDISVVGRGAGLEGKQSSLFFEILRLAKEIQPPFIFLENVPAIRTRGLRAIGDELAQIRYDLRWGVISAFDVGAPHLRERWFCLAYSSCKRRRENPASSYGHESQNEGRETEKTDKPQRNGKRNRARALADTESEPMGGAGQPREKGHIWEPEPDVGRVVNGISFRMDRIKCLGNAVVPAQVSEAFKRLMGVHLSKG